MERTAPILEKVESGFNSTYRFGLHESDVRNRVESNAFHKHLEIHHPEHQGDMSVFKCKVIGTYKRSLDRQVAEGVQLERSEADLVLNSRAEFHGSAVPRVTVSHDTRDTRDTRRRDTRDTNQSSQPGPRGARQWRRPGGEGEAAEAARHRQLRRGAGS